MNLFRNLFFFIILSLLFTATSAQEAAKTATPPMGWNSWDSYSRYPSQESMLKNVEVMAKKLKPFGYEYFVIDAGWNNIANSNGDIIALSMDEYGRYIPNKATFPDGVKVVGDRAHALGLKFGIHIMRGISREAYKQNLPVFGTKYTARDIVDTTSVCSWSKENYGVNMTKPGAQEYYDSYISELVRWGVDFIKADDISGYPAEIDAVIKAINKTGKKVILSISPGGDSRLEYFNTYKKASMLRVTRDVWDDQIGIDRVFAAWKKWTNIDHTGFWLDMDMIPFGHLNLYNPDPNFLALKGKKKSATHKSRMSSFTTDQKYTFMALRALSASPLFMGGDLPTSDDFSFQLLTNKEMLKCNQNGIAGKLVYNKDGIEIWKTPNKKDPKNGWIGVFNRGKELKTLSLSNTDLGLAGISAKLYDIWKKEKCNKITTSAPLNTTVNANGVLFCTYKTN